MRFVLGHDKRNISDEDLLGDLGKVASALGKISLTEREYEEKGQYGVTTVIRRFGGWSKAMQKAGLQKMRASNITKEELFENIETVWMKLGRQPSYAEMRKPLSAFHAASYERKFGSWRKALEEFVLFVGSEDRPETLTARDPQKQSISRNSRTVSLRLRFLVMRRDNFKCKVCGKSPATDPMITLEVDHLVPWSAGGETVEDNLQTLCVLCNQGKSNLSMETTL